LREPSKIENKNFIYEMVNSLSSVAFKINNQVLEFILENGKKFNLIIDQELEHPLEIKLKNSKLTKKEKRELNSYLSKKYLEKVIFEIAFIFKDLSEFFIPVRIDNRGRVYCESDYLNYQSIDLARALLLFSKSEKIFKHDSKSIDYLKIFGANCFGNKLNKKSFVERIKWIDENEENILNFKNGILINKAENKPLFISFCFEYLNYKTSLLNNNNYFYTHLPIQLDATCNGYQHSALLIGDKELGLELNIGKCDDNDDPYDYYNYIALKLKYFFRQKLSEIKNDENHIDKDLLKNYERLLNLEIHRNMVKGPIMIKPYNATYIQIINKLKEDFDSIGTFDANKKFIGYHKHKEHDNLILYDQDFSILAKTIEIIIYKEFPKLKELNNYLKKVAEVCSILNITIP
jgi:DNA-directed RNA polymerase